ncbi:MAG: alpha/beta fold hydrolase [Rubrivivax sp.]|nr:alpha/beta fold hydrolase [Rubrivivax sp.]MDP3611002.1 alpha/beta fold hydrolase [Rubrivivax sp.]
MPSAHRVLILPGWQNSGPAHWQSRWQALHDFVRVEQADWDWPLRGDWMVCLENAVRSDPRPTSLVAHSLGCQLVAAWAAHSQHKATITGALLVAPPDTARDDMPPQLASWRHIVRQRLPFKALVAYSNDDPFCAPDRAREMAADWGASTLPMGAAGHINADTGLGDWPDGLDLIRQLQATSA